MHALVGDVSGLTGSIGDEAGGLADHLLLAVKIVAAEVTGDLEGLGVVSVASTGRVLAEVTRGYCLHVGGERLSGNVRGHQLVLGAGVGHSSRHSCVLALHIAAPIVLLAVTAINVVVALSEASLIEVLAITVAHRLGV